MDQSSETANRVAPEFEEELQRIRDYFFSRNPEYWPVFHNTSFRHVIDFRAKNLNPGERMGGYPNSASLVNRLERLNTFETDYKTPSGNSDELLLFTAAMSKDWENPSSVENVITMPCDPAINGAMLGSLANPNLVYSEYSGMATELEKAVIRQMASLVGYDPEQATGIFTQGGTFCNLYGYLTGIRKNLPQAREYGMGYTNDYRIINSQGGHYSNTTNLSLLGVNIREKTIRLKLNRNNDIDLNDLERQMESCFRLNCVVPCIMLTMGTTDTFGVDRVKPVRDIVDKLCDRFDAGKRPHIHVDSAIGWSMIFFLTYDCENNPLRINAQTLAGLRKHVDHFRELRYADSFTVDFQKWGYVPYTSSLVMFRDKGDLKYLENDPENFSYFEKNTQGQTHLQSTIECSRGAAGVFGAYAALQHMGIKGYQIILANCLQNANYFRLKLSKVHNAVVMVAENQGPCVGFKLYNPEWVQEPQAEFEFECNFCMTPEYEARLTRNSQWHRELFVKRGKRGLFTNWVEFIAHSNYDEKERFSHMPGEKAVFMNPLTTRREIDDFISVING